ncbi:3-oxoacyl-[acyl-carrier-protein] reductase FabG-like [Anticarsia gemmatalis]|uniref:3-oxoacyl-[acyl-carrier-protein] reductase FabG-like n=1 Tax=Anticarsia gemmatalis TaxID=129554 RepID=UPI003F767E58
MSFENKVVLVTGGSTGIGAAIAIKMSTQRAKVAIVARNEERLKIVSETCERNGSETLVIIADVTKDARKIVSDTVQRFGRIDVLVNNAGMFDLVSILDPFAMEKFDHIFRTNLRSVVQLTHLAAPHLIQTKGNIINISSAGSTGIFFSENFSYCSSKAGLDHFSRCVALELAAKGVRVNCVNPGPVRTNFIERATLDEEERDKLLDKINKTTALGKVADPEEIADIVLFLASDTAKSITGSTYVIDNGLLLKGMSE